MAIRTVRLDDDTEQVLREIQAATGMRVSEALKRGLQTLRAELDQGTDRSPFEIYSELHLGDGGDARGSSSDVKQTLRTLLRRKNGR